MKKLYTLLAIAFISLAGNAQIVNIPDANFKAKLLSASSSNTVASTQTPSATGTVTSYSKIDTNNDGQIQVSEALAIKYLAVPNSNISDLTGIESFTNLRYLSCRNNLLTSINISALTNLEFFYCYSNQLTSLNISNNPNLQSLQCYSNQLISLNTSANPNLKSLLCQDNSLTDLNITNCLALTYIDCSDNQLSSLDVSNRTSLTTLYCYRNLIVNLNLNNTPALQVLYCSSNLLTSLDVTNNLALVDLAFDNNQIQTINLNPLINIEILSMGSNPYTSPVNLSTLINLNKLYVMNISDISVFPLNNSSMPLLTNLEILKADGSNIGNFNYTLIPNLKQLLCRSSGMTTMDNIPTGLLTLAVENNQITTLDFTGFSNLQELNFARNPVTSLTWGSHPNLTSIWAGNTLLTNIDLSTLSALYNLDVYNSAMLTSVNIKNGRISNYVGLSNCPNLIYVCADDGEINTVQNAITIAVTNFNGNPNCHVNTYCTFEPGGTFYTIQGNHRWDTTNNGCDNSDFLFPNMKFTISNGTTSTTLISSADGSYHYDVPAGTYTVTPVLENPTYFTTTSSTTGNIVFPTATSPYVRDFCVRSVANNPDLEVAVFPLRRAVPGFDFSCKVVYRNKGGVPQNGTVTLVYDDAVQDLISSTITPSTQATGSLSWNFSNLMPFQARTIFLKFNLNTPMETPALNSGDNLQYNATVSGAVYTDIAPIDNTATLNQEVVNSQDPNDKTCVEGTTISPSMVGQYVHYIVRFENTGTAHAENIVVKDIIDTTKFDIATLVPLDGSHPFYTRISNTNQVEFVFENIQLPFDDANNDGYVAFKIKTKPTLAVGDTFSNGANIYFDYNYPITTNTFSTTVQTLGNPDFDFSSVFTLSPVPAKNTLTITTKENVVMSSVSIYNTLGQLVQVSANPGESIDVSGLQSGSYFIKITGDKGSATGKFIKE